METIRIIKNLWRVFLRVVKYIDFPVQTIILVGMLVFTFVTKDAQRWWSEYVPLTYLLIGSWQMFSAVLFFFARAPFGTARMIHLGLSVFVLTFLMTDILPVFPRSIEHFLLSALWVAPGLLALFYYGITGKWAFQKIQTRGFLPHINF